MPLTPEQVAELKDQLRQQVQDLGVTSMTCRLDLHDGVSDFCMMYLYCTKHMCNICKNHVCMHIAPQSIYIHNSLRPTSLQNSLNKHGKYDGKLTRLYDMSRITT